MRASRGKGGGEELCGKDMKIMIVNWALLCSHIGVNDEVKLA